MDLQLLTYVDAETKEAFQEIASANERSVAGELRALIRRHIEEHEKNRQLASMLPVEGAFESKPE